MKSFLDYLGADEDSTDEEDEQQQPVPPRAYEPVTVSIDEAFRQELRDLRKYSRFHEAEKIEQKLPMIRVFFEGAPEKLKGVTGVDPVKKFIEERMETCLPFPFREEEPLLGEDAWDFILNHSDNLLRILYNIHSPFLFPADIMLKHVGTVFDNLQTKIGIRLRKEHVKRLQMRVGCDPEEVEQFAKENPDTLADELRMRMSLKETCQKRGMDEKQVEEILKDLPECFMSFSLHNKQKENTEKRVVINASRENSPEREATEKEPNEEEEEEDYNDLTFLLPPPIPDGNAKPKKSLLRNANWYRSDKIKSGNLPFIGKCAYNDYRKTKKNVRFISDTPTRCFVWRRGTRFVQNDRGNINEVVARDQVMESLEVDYETYVKKRRFPTSFLPLKRAASTYGYAPKSTRKMDKMNFKEWKRRNPVSFMKKPIRPYVHKSGDGSCLTLPGHVGYVEQELGELCEVQWKNMEHMYYERMLSFCIKHNFSGCRKLVRSCYRPPTPSNYSLGVLMITDSVLEEVEHGVLLNTLLCSFVPPMHEKNALKLLIDCREAIDGVRDLVISWGFERMASFQGDDLSTEAFNSLVCLTLKIRYICKLRCEKANTEASDYDTIRMPKFWIMTIPEEGELAPIFTEYNSNIRKWCATDDEFNLLDWAQLVSDAPPEYLHKLGSDVGTDRRVALLFRLCREKFDLLYRRSDGERLVEFENKGSLGNGPWLKNIYQVFE